MKGLLLALVASSALAQPIGRVDQGKGLTDGGTWSVNCTNCAGGASSGDGGTIVTSSVLPTGAATEATLLTLLTSGTFTARLGTLGQKTMAGSAPVVFASDQTALPVSGTFWQATQPVSGTVTAQLADAGIVSVANLPGDGGAPAQDTTEQVNGTTLNAIRLALEALLIEAQQQTLILQTLHSSGNGP